MSNPVRAAALKADSMSDQILKVLLVEDNPTDVLLLQDTLQGVPGAKVELTHVDRLHEALTALKENHFDAVLLDLGLPDSQGLETFRALQTREPTVPILVLSGLDDENVTLRALQQGAQDYLVKGTIDSHTLVRTIRYAIQRKRTAERLANSELSYRRLFEASRDGIFIINAESGEILEANPYLEELLGYPNADLIGKRLWEIGAFREKEASKVAFRTLENHGYIRHDDLKLCTKDGRVVNVEWVSNVYGVQDKRVVQCNLRDISERKGAQDELDRFFTLSLDVLCVANPQGYFTRLNPAIESILGFSREELMCRPFIEFVHPGDVEITLDHLQKLADGAKTVSIELRILCADGGYKWLNWTKASYNGYLYAAARDVTDLRATQDALRQSYEEMESKVLARTLELAHANQAKSDFLSRMSHELRTPLNAILGFGQILEMQRDLDARDTEAISYILKGGRHLLGLINEVLDLASIEAGKISLSLGPVDMCNTVHDVLNMVRPLAKGSNIELVSLIPEDQELQVVADPQRLSQVLVNLLSNAIKYNREGGRVTASCRREGTWLHVGISDTGAGITPEDKLKLFVPFERLEAAKSKIEGSGIGLALSKRLMEAMMGRIGVESELGAGSEFWIEVPLAMPQQNSGNQESEYRLNAPDHGHGPNEAVSRPPKTVLYIEDNLSNFKVIESLMTLRSEIKLLSAMQGSIGLDLARQHVPDVILLDLHLPDMPGEVVLQRLRADAATWSIPVIILSADATAQQMARLRGAGIREYLTKPIDLKRFLLVLDQTLSDRDAGPNGP